MPIVIKKGSDAVKKKRSKHGRQRPSSRSSTPPERINTDNIATDMTDVLNFKAYRIIKPNFYNNTTRINLIGEDYYREDDPGLPENIGVDGNPIPPPTVTAASRIDELIKLQHQNESLGKAQKVDLFSRIKDFEKKSVSLKSGHSIEPLLVAPTLEETLVWAIKYVTINEDNLALTIINLYYNMKCYDNTVEKKLKQHKDSNRSSPSRSRANTEESPGRERTTSDDLGRERTASEDWTRRDRTVSESSWGDGAFNSSPPPAAPTNKNHGQRRSSRQMSASMIDPALSAAGDKANATQRGKNISLAQQLEQIKSQGTDAFIKSITPHKEPIFPAGKRNWKGQAPSHQQQHRASSGDLRESASSQSLDLTKPHRPSANKPGSSQGGRGGRTTGVPSMSAFDESDEQPTPRGSEYTPHKTNGSFSPRASSTSPARDSKTMMSPRKPAPPSNQASSSARSSHRRVEATLRPAERTSGSPGHSKKPGLNPVIQQTVDMSQQALQALLQRTTAMQTTIAAKIRKAEHAGMRLIRKQNDFSAVAGKAHDRALGMVDEREFQRPLTLLHQVTSFEDHAEASPRSRVGKGLSNDLRLMRSVAEKKTFDVQMQRLVQHRWFVATMLKLREFMKKMHNQAPMCCLKFVVVLQQVLLMDYAVDQTVFYSVLEATVQPEDHLKSITHQLLRIVRRALGIADPVFLKYLEDKEISPHPELINQVKMMNRPQKKPSQTAAALAVMRASAFGSALGLGRMGSVKVAFNVTDDETATGSSSAAITFSELSVPSSAGDAPVSRSPTAVSPVQKNSPLKPAIRTEPPVVLSSVPAVADPSARLTGASHTPSKVAAKEQNAAGTTKGVILNAEQV